MDNNNLNMFQEDYSDDMQDESQHDSQDYSQEEVQNIKSSQLYIGDVPKPEITNSPAK
jgi:hypothetical protein